MIQQTSAEVVYLSDLNAIPEATRTLIPKDIELLFIDALFKTRPVSSHFSKNSPSVSDRHRFLIAVQVWSKLSQK
jgi:hypothetical protein